VWRHPPPIFYGFTSWKCTAAPHGLVFAGELRPHKSVANRCSSPCLAPLNRGFVIRRSYDARFTVQRGERSSNRSFGADLLESVKWIAKAGVPRAIYLWRSAPSPSFRRGFLWEVIFWSFAFTSLRQIVKWSCCGRKEILISFWLCFRKFFCDFWMEFFFKNTEWILEYLFPKEWKVSLIDT